MQQRGAEIIKARGASSAASAANAIVDSVRSLTITTEKDNWFSVAVCSDGSYGTQKGLITSFPVRSVENKWEIVQGLDINDYSKIKIDASIAELQEERELVCDLLS